MGVLRRHPILSMLAVLLAGALALLLITGAAVWRAAHTDDASRIDTVDLIVVLGAAQYEGTPSPVFAGRLDHALLLYEEHRAARVLVVGGNQPGDVTTEAQAGRDYLIERGLPPDVVDADPRGRTTLESLRAAAGYMRAHDLESAFLVSDPWHNLRVERMASDLGIRAYASATWHSAARTELTRLGGYVRETFGYLYYRVFGR